MKNKLHSFTYRINCFWIQDVRRTLSGSRLTTWCWHRGRHLWSFWNILCGVVTVVALQVSGRANGWGSYFIWAFLFVARDLDEQVQYGIIEIGWSLFTCISRVSKVLTSFHLLSYPCCRVLIMCHVAQELLMIAKLSWIDWWLYSRSNVLIWKMRPTSVTDRSPLHKLYKGSSQLNSASANCTLDRYWRGTYMLLLERGHLLSCTMELNCDSAEWRVVGNLYLVLRSLVGK